MPNDRADAILMARGLCDSREQAKRLILAGEVLCGTTVVSKPSSKIDTETDITIKTRPKFVSRAGFKIEKAFDFFEVDVQDLVCLDCGSSTGGFTDCMLQRGARQVHAIDVGTNQLVWKLRNDPRVIVKEKFNARYMELADIGGEPVDICVTDVSFISLTKILPALFRVLKEGGCIICLIKPQFELSKDEVSKGGLVKDDALHQKAIDKIHSFVTEELKREWIAVTESPITGTTGNKEFLAYLR